MTTLTPIKQVNYSDIDFHFLAHPITKKIRTLKNIDAIKQSVRNIIMMNQFEKLYDPTFYTNLTHNLFENITSIVVNSIRTKIKWALKNFEPRVNLVDVIVEEDFDRNGFSVFVIFTIQNVLEPVTVEAFIERVR